MRLDEVSWVFESSGQVSNWQGAVISSKLASRVHALLKVTELKINMELIIAFSLDVLYYMFHTLNSFASLSYSFGSFRTNVEGGGKKKQTSLFPSPFPSLLSDSLQLEQLILIRMVWQQKEVIHCEALWCQSLGEATSSFLWAAVGAMWNYLVVLKIAFRKTGAACICRMGCRSGVVKCLC